jgi:hypothetical protein
VPIDLLGDYYEPHIWPLLLVLEVVPYCRFEERYGLMDGRVSVRSPDGLRDLRSI